MRACSAMDSALASGASGDSSTLSRRMQLEQRRTEGGVGEKRCPPRLGENSVSLII